MKKYLRKESYRRVSTSLDTERTLRNSIESIYTVAILAVTYSFNILNWTQDGSQGVTWSGTCHPWEIGYHLFANPGSFLAVFYSCLIFVAKERSLKILLNLGFCDILDLNLFLHTNYLFNCDNTKYLTFLTFLLSDSISSNLPPLTDNSAYGLDRTVSDIKKMNTKIRKLITYNRMHHPKAGLDR